MKDTMKRLLLILSMLMVLLVPAMGQEKAPEGKRGKSNHAEMMRKVQEYKVKYLVQEMGLTGDTEKQFREVYGRMSAERGEIFRESRQIEKRIAKSQDASDADYAAATKALTAAREKDAEIEKKYDAEFSKFLTPKQIFKMKSAEAEFFERMRKMRKKK